MRGFDPPPGNIIDRSGSRLRPKVRTTRMRDLQSRARQRIQ
jgi:hypothetical protein